MVLQRWELYVCTPLEEAITYARGHNVCLLATHGRTSREFSCDVARAQANPSLRPLRLPFPTRCSLASSPRPSHRFLLPRARVLTWRRPRHACATSRRTHRYLRTSFFCFILFGNLYLFPRSFFFVVGRVFRRRTLVGRFSRLSSAWSTTRVCTCDKTRWMVGSSWRRAQA